MSRRHADRPPTGENMSARTTTTTTAAMVTQRVNADQTTAGEPEVGANDRRVPRDDTVTTTPSPSRDASQTPAARDGAVAETPSRQLDFQDVRREEEGEEDEEDEEEAVIVGSSRPSPKTSSKRRRSTSDATESPRAPQRRRHVVRWTKTEETFLAEGVERFGEGKWAAILREGRGIFHPHRTNVDLKDKWRSLKKTRPSQSTSAQASPQRAAAATTTSTRRDRRAPPRAAARLAASAMVAVRAQEETQSDPSHLLDHPEIPPSRNVRVPSTDETQGESSSEDVEIVDPPPTPQSPTAEKAGPEETLSIRICTDASFPRLLTFTVNARACVTVTALKRELSQRLLEDSPLPTNLQLVGIRSRRLLGDLETVATCLKADGRALYLLYDP